MSRNVAASRRDCSCVDCVASDVADDSDRNRKYGALDGHVHDSRITVLPNVAALPKPSRTKGKSSYRNVVPVMANNPQISQEIFNRSIKGKIELTQEELMAVAPSIRNYYREAVSTKRIPTERVPEREITKVFAMQEPFDDGSSISVDWNVDDFKEKDRHPDIVSSFMHQQSPPPGTRVAPDPYEQYLKELPADAELPMAYTVVADESVILRTVWPVIENHSAVECVVDPGCQIVAMSEAIAERVGLQYDPTVILTCSLRTALWTTLSGWLGTWRSGLATSPYIFRFTFSAIPPTMFY